MKDDDLHKLQAQIAQLRGELQATQALARNAFTQAHLARRAATELVRVTYGVLIDSNIVPRNCVHQHLAATLKNMRGRQENVPGINELAKEIEYLIKKFGDDGEKPTKVAERRKQFKVITRR